MSLETQITSLVSAIGADIKALRTNAGDLTSLTTTNKTSLVAALNELKTLVGTGGGSSINDTSATNSTTTTYSANKINASISNAVAALVASSPAALDTLNELAAALGNDPAFSATIATALSNRVRYDASQTLSAAQQLQACVNIGVGDPTHNYLADYIAAKA